MKINGLQVTAKKFAFDGCHKIYLIENEYEEANARELGYNIHPIDELRLAYEGSCSLRFISNWPLDNDEFVSYVGQFEKARFEEGMKYKNLKLNDAFRFLEHGNVYVRCRGGYRLGCGGALVKFRFPDCPVFLYQEKVKV